MNLRIVNIKLRVIVFSNMLNLFYACNTASNQGESDNITKTATNPVTQDDSKTTLVGKFYINTPKNFSLANESEIKLKYPGKNRPQYVFTDKNMAVNLAYTENENRFLLGELRQYLESTTKTIKHSLGDDAVAQSEMDTINGIPFAIMEFYSPTIDEGKIYNLVFTTSLNEKKIIISFNCLQSLMPEWENKIPDIFSSIALD
jgi:hypothetical protein